MRTRPARGGAGWRVDGAGVIIGTVHGVDGE